ncbi:hypothetical protein OBBRIDRAFT_825042 [Obba rivulosa]|uniref:DUF6534 domain-containing protein n=1 Tax=Obba rivulosa TaxID=1052685 RepID=A0A8E2AVW9_9APHY|nr:hypothetical protein OBBRIDRAFT_825042 [Obba rivulosa]
MGQFDSSLGALFLGQFVSAVYISIRSLLHPLPDSTHSLYGITSLQTGVYFRRKSQDPFAMRCLVFLIWILDCFHVTLVTLGIYSYLVTHFDDIVVASKPNWSFSMLPATTTISMVVIRSVFVYRLWKLSNKSVFMPIVVAALSLFSTGDSIYLSVKLLSIPSWLALRQYSWCMYGGLGAQILAEVIIMTSQYTYLRRFRCFNSTFTSTSSVIQTIMTYSINTCLIVCLCAVMCLVTAAVFPNDLIFAAFYCASSKFYSNALLANLNARDFLQESLRTSMPSFIKRPSKITTIPLSWAQYSDLPSALLHMETAHLGQHPVVEPKLA